MLSACCHSVTPVASWYLWVIHSWITTSPPPPPGWGVWVECHDGGECTAEVKKIQSLRMTCHKTRWLNHWVCGTYGAAGHSDINTLWITATAWRAARWHTGGAASSRAPTTGDLKSDWITWRETSLLSDLKLDLKIIHYRKWCTTSVTWPHEEIDVNKLETDEVKRVAVVTLYV